jgi:hypothetical protein
VHDCCKHSCRVFYYLPGSKWFHALCSQWVVQLLLICMRVPHQGEPETLQQSTKFNTSFHSSSDQNSRRFSVPKRLMPSYLWYIVWLLRSSRRLWQLMSDTRRSFGLVSSRSCLRRSSRIRQSPRAPNSKHPLQHPPPHILPSLIQLLQCRPMLQAATQIAPILWTWRSGRRCKPITWQPRSSTCTRLGQDQRTVYHRKDTLLVKSTSLRRVTLWLSMTTLRWRS